MLADESGTLLGVGGIPARPLLLVFVFMPSLLVACFVEEEEVMGKSNACCSLLRVVDIEADIDGGIRTGLW